MAERIMQAVQYSGYGGGAAALKRAEIGIPSTKRVELLLKVEAVSINPVAEGFGTAWELVKEGKIRTVVESVHALSDAAAVWARSMEGRATGKIIVEMQD